MCVCVCVCVCMCICVRAVWCRFSPTCERKNTNVMVYYILIIKIIAGRMGRYFQDYQHAKNAILEPWSWYKEEALFCMQTKVKKEVAAINMNLWEIWEWYFILLIYLVFILLLYYIISSSKLHLWFWSIMATTNVCLSVIQWFYLLTNWLLYSI